MSYITKDLLTEIIEENIPFLNEYEFQFAVAMAIKEHNPDLKVKIEQNIYCDKEQENCRCDIVALNKNEEEVLFVELKYVITFGAQSDKTSMGARMSFVSDIKRLYDLKDKYPLAEKYCVFVTNKKAVFDNTIKCNYFNENYAKKELWTPVSFSKSKNFQNVDNVHFLIINAKEAGADIPDDYKY